MTTPRSFRFSVASLSSFALFGLMSPNLAAQADVPTGGTPSPLFGAQPFTQKLLRFEEFGTYDFPTVRPNSGRSLPQPATTSCCPTGPELDSFLEAAESMYPWPERRANDLDINPWQAQIESYLGRAITDPPCDGRPFGEGWAHQRWDEFPIEECFQSVQTGARVNGGYRDHVQMHGYAVGEFGPGGLYHNTTGLPGFDGTTAGIEIRIHPNMPIQSPLSVWTFDGTLPPKLLMGRYGRGIMFRHHNALPIDPAANNGFGFHTLTTHEHNGHNPAESDGYAHAYIYPGQFYDYRWPMILAGHDTINRDASDPRAGYPDGNGGIVNIPGDWREMASTHWFHDHSLDHTAQNVYKGNAAMFNYYSSVDRGNEAIEDGVNLRLPSGSALDWGNRDYDVNLVFADKAWDREGQLWFNPFNTDGFIADRVTVNWQWKPYFDVRARRYRFRLLNGCVARYFKFALVKADGTPVPFHMVANDGNIMEHAVAFDGTLGTTAGILPEQAIGERYDIVVDFSQFQPGERLFLVNVLPHLDGRNPEREIVPVQNILNGTYNPVAVDIDGDGLADQWQGGDPCVTTVMEFRVHAYAGQDLSMDPADYVAGGRKMVPLPRPSANELANARHHTFHFGRSDGTDQMPWTIETDGGPGMIADYTVVSVAANLGDLSADGMGHLEIWHFDTGGGWDHPVHVHFEEGIVLSRDGQMPPEWERWARKDIFRIGSGPDSTREMEIALRFREFAGTYVEHCHNTMHEDTAMLLRWDIEKPGQLSLLPAPIPSWEGVFTVPSTALPLARVGDGTGSTDPMRNVESPSSRAGRLGVTQAAYSAQRGWTIRGTLSGTTGEVHVRAYLGGLGEGPAIGSARVVNGSWQISGDGPAPGNFAGISVNTTSGTRVHDVNFTAGR